MGDRREALRKTDDDYIGFEPQPWRRRVFRLFLTLSTAGTSRVVGPWRRRD